MISYDLWYILSNPISCGVVCSSSIFGTQTAYPSAFFFGGYMQTLETWLQIDVIPSFCDVVCKAQSLLNASKGIQAMSTGVGITVWIGFIAGMCWHWHIVVCRFVDWSILCSPDVGQQCPEVLRSLSRSRTLAKTRMQREIDTVDTI